MDARTLARHVRARELSPVEILEDMLAWISSTNPDVCAIDEPAFASARAKARRLAQDIAHGCEVGALAGVPVAVSDELTVRNPRVLEYAKTHLGLSFSPDESVLRLEAADAVIVGRTGTAGLVCRAVDRAPRMEVRDPWGRSSVDPRLSRSAATAVATNMVPLALAPDEGGSLRIAAALTGTYALKPSVGRIPHPRSLRRQIPNVSTWESLQQMGPASRAVSDAALMLSVLAAGQPRSRRHLGNSAVDWARALEKGFGAVKIGVLPPIGLDLPRADIDEAVDAAATEFASSFGCVVERVEPIQQSPLAALWPLAAAESDLRRMRDMIYDLGSEVFDPGFVDFISYNWTAEAITDAAAERQSLERRLCELMDVYDLLITATLPSGLPHAECSDTAGSGELRLPSWCGPAGTFNLTGQPVANVPVLLDGRCLPTGVQLIGRYGDDELVLRASAALEAARPWVLPPRHVEATNAQRRE